MAVMMASRTSGRWLYTSTVVAALTSGLLTDGTVVGTAVAARRNHPRSAPFPMQHCPPAGSASSAGCHPRIFVSPTGRRSSAAGHNAPVTTAAPTISARIHSLNRPNMVSVGTIVWLSSELMFFAGLFAIYFTARAQNPPGSSGRRAPTELDIPYALVVTIVLVASSFTCQFGVFAAERGDVFGLRRWYLLTLVMGTFFVLGQANEYHTLVTEHETTIASSAYGTVFYLTTGFHGLHVIGGLHRLRLPAHPHQALQVHARAGHRRDRRVVLLALRRRGVDRAVRRHLLHPMTPTDARHDAGR